MSRKILIIVTSNARMGDSGKPTGLWLEELVIPYLAFTRTGMEVTIASPQGGPAPIDPNSIKTVGQNSPEIDQFLTDPDANHQLRDTRRLSELNAADFDGIFFPGGHGAMWDLPDNPDVVAIVNQAWAMGRVVGAVCHGPAGLIGATKEDGSALVEGLCVNAFTDSEERASGLMDTVPFALESRLRELGAHFENGPDFTPYAVRDSRLVTGQNPQSSEQTARLFLEALDEELQKTNMHAPPETAGSVSAAGFSG
ncbi:MAG TPA: type 1 glutamine amidotransferase domain-containing protein [Burkholderiaceae bacterium]|nr:type 1 glutamine amidotransferase domain-containing protein [Burkholderiaceae bacterium]